MIELTEQQVQTIPAIGTEPVRVVDRRTGKRFVLIGEQQFEDWQRWTAIEESRASIAPGVLRSMEAFWRDLQDLLTRWRRRGKFVLYQQEQQLAFAAEWAKSRGLVRSGQHAVLVRGQVAGEDKSRAVLAREVR